MSCKKTRHKEAVLGRIFGTVPTKFKVLLLPLLSETFWNLIWGQIQMYYATMKAQVYGTSPKPFCSLVLDYYLKWDLAQTFDKIGRVFIMLTLLYETTQFLYWKRRLILFMANSWDVMLFSWKTQQIAILTYLADFECISSLIINFQFWLKSAGNNSNSVKFSFFLQ